MNTGPSELLQAWSVESLPIRAAISGDAVLVLSTAELREIADVYWHICLRLSCGIFVSGRLVAYLSPSVLWHFCFRASGGIVVSECLLAFLFPNVW